MCASSRLGRGDGTALIAPEATPPTWNSYVALFDRVQRGKLKFHSSLRTPLNTLERLSYKFAPPFASICAPFRWDRDSSCSVGRVADCLSFNNGTGLIRRPATTLSRWRRPLDRLAGLQTVGTEKSGGRSVLSGRSQQLNRRGTS